MVDMTADPMAAMWVALLAALLEMKLVAWKAQMSGKRMEHKTVVQLEKSMADRWDPLMVALWAAQMVD